MIEDIEVGENEFVSSMLDDIIEKAALDSEVSTLPIIKSLLDSNNKLFNRVCDLEQYSMKNSLLLLGHLGINPKLKGTQFSKKIVNFLNTYLFFPNINNRKLLCKKISLYDIDTSHPLKSRNSDSAPVTIIKFVRRDLRNEIFFNRKELLKRAGVTVVEHLTSRNKLLLKKAESIAGKDNTWSNQGVVFMKLNEVKYKITCEKDLPQPAPAVVLSDVPAASPNASSASSSTVLNIAKVIQNSAPSNHSDTIKIDSNSRNNPPSYHKKKKYILRGKQTNHRTTKNHEHFNHYSTAPNYWLNQSQNEQFPRLNGQIADRHLGVDTAMPITSGNYDDGSQYYHNNHRPHIDHGNYHTTNRMYWGGGYAGNGWYR